MACLWSVGKQNLPSALCSVVVPFFCLLHKGEPSVSFLTSQLREHTPGPQSYDLESRQPHLRRSGATALWPTAFFVKAKIRVSPEESETKTLDQNLCCYSYISAKCEGATYTCTRAHTITGRGEACHCT